MEKLVGKYLNKENKLNIADIGSFDVNGTYKRFFSNPLWSYTGIDISAGKNVDIVVKEHDWSNVVNDSYDIVVSGQTLEHVNAPWDWILKIKNICKPGGLIMIIAPWKWVIHRHPVDCWRILPDGMQYLLGVHSGLDVLEVGVIENDCFGVAKKK